MEEKTNLHKGHRQRLKDKVKRGGVGNLSDHEVLELLLTYTIPQKDTNELAHMLINQFGSFSAVLDSSFEELLKVNGVGKETALFLSLLPDIFELYKANKSNNKVTILKNTETCVTYFRQNFEIKNNENFYLVCVNKFGRPIKTIIIKGHNDHKVPLDIKDITRNITSSNTFAVLLYHTHPKGEVKPSSSDLEATQTILNVCALSHIVFCDHIIFNENSHLSLACGGFLDSMFDSVLKTFPELSNCHIRFQQNSNFEYADVVE